MAPLRLVPGLPFRLDRQSDHLCPAICLQSLFRVLRSSSLFVSWRLWRSSACEKGCQLGTALAKGRKKKWEMERSDDKTVDGRTCVRRPDEIGSKAANIIRCHRHHHRNFFLSSILERIRLLCMCHWRPILASILALHFATPIFGNSRPSHNAALESSCRYSLCSN